MKKLAISIILGLSAAMASAQAIKISTGSSSGSYSRITKELSTACMSLQPVAESNSAGSMENVDRLVGNTTQAAFVQTDVLFFRSRSEDLSSVKTLVAFHPEQVHVVATAQVFKEGGTLGFGAKEVQMNTLDDLQGRTVVASGGSFITAQVIRLQTEINFNLVEVETADLAIKYLTEGKASAAILVGGAPLNTISVLDKRFKLLAFTENHIGKLKNVYKPAKLNYSKIGAAGVSTVSTDAILVSREYKTPKMIESLSKLRKCIMDNAAEIAETDGTHPAWQSVDVTNQGKWPWYELKQPVVNSKK